MSLFKDFGKPAKDLLSKNYTFDKNKIEVVSKTGDVSFEGEWVSAGVSKFETEIKLPHNTTATVECLSDNKITTTFKLKDIFQGAVFKAKASTANRAFLGIEYTHESGTLTGDVDHDLSKGASDVNASALFARRKFLLGGALQLGFQSSASTLNKYELGVGYSEPKKFEATALVSEDCKKGAAPQLTLQYVHYADAIWTYAAKFATALQDGSKPTAELGGTYLLSSDTKLGAKINNAGLLGLYAVTKPDPNVTLTHSLQVDINGGGAAHKFGFGVKFSR
jgi:hypothetical protein